MNADPDFFTELKEWSERKHLILSKYLKMAAMMLGNVVYIDGFAGRGWYDSPNGEQIKGSPLRAAELAKEFSEQQRSYSLRCINIERDPALFRQLETATAPYQGYVTNICGEFVNSLDSILAQVRNDPVICFLDPFGVKGIDLSAIRRLLRRGNGITDLWIRLDTGTIPRLDGFHEHDAASAEQNIDTLKRVYGIMDANKLHAGLQAPTAKERRKRAAELYMGQLLQEYAAVRRGGFACRYHIRTLKGKEKYHLIFAAGDKLPLLRTSEILYDAEEQYKADKQWYLEQRTGQPSLFGLMEPTPDDIFNEKVSQICAQVSQDFSGITALRDEINEHLIIDKKWFGRMKGTHLTAALKRLVAEGKATANSKRFSDDETRFTFCQTP